MGVTRHPAYREAHPLPYVLLHWTHLLSMLVLAFTGLFVHYPFLPLPMGAVRGVHMVAAYAVLIALLVRVWYAVFGRSALRKDTREVGRDIRNFLPQQESRGAFVETLRYYLFLRPTHPETGKYNPLQKLAYVFIGLLLVAQAFTGFLLYGPVLEGALGPAAAAVVALLGGPMAVRTFHYLLTWVFVAITVVHVYLSLTEDIAGIPLMFLWRETPDPTVSTEETADAF